MQEFFDQISIVLVVVCFVGLLLIIFKEKLKTIYNKLPERLKKILTGVNKRVRFIPLVILISLVYFCSKSIITADGVNCYKTIVETPIEDVSDFKGFTQGFTDLSAKFSFKSSKYIRIRNIEKYETITDTTYEDSMRADVMLNRFKGSFRNEELVLCNYDNVIMKEYYNEKTEKKNAYTQTTRTKITYLQIKNKGLHFFKYSVW